jgi:hypothetical protein
MPAILHGPSGPITLGVAVLTIGRAPDNSLVLPSASVAPHHAEIRSASLGGRRSYSLIDLGSSTGTFVNEQRLTAHVPHLLTTGDRMRIGETLFLYQGSEGAARATPGPAPAGAGQGGPLGYQVPSPASWPPSPSSERQPPRSFPLPAGTAGLPGAGWLRRRRWLVLSVLGVVLLAVLAAVLLVSQPPSARTLDTYCTALTGGDYQAVYRQLSPRLQAAGSEQQLARLLALDKVTSCSHGPVSQTGTRAMATLSLVHASGVKSEDVVVLVQGSDGNWKIDLIRQQ